MEPSFPHPSFSIVIETENLSVADVESLIRCLESLEAQVPGPAAANEVILAESGDVPSEMLEKVLARYPWISRLRLSPGSGYYEAKMEGFARISGQVVVFCDSDCVYQPGWLENLLFPFNNGDLDILAGETSIHIDGPYSLSIALTWYMPPYSGRSDMYPSAGYACNNVAFRSSFLKKYPIPCGLGWYRGNCTLHALELLKEGYTIWKQSRSRGTHPLIKRSHVFWRMMLAAHHELMSYREMAEAKPGTRRGGAIYLALVAVPKITARRLLRPIIRLIPAVRQNLNSLLYLPFALPWIIGTTAVFFAGLTVSFFRPGFFKRTWGMDLRDGNLQP